MFQKRVLSNATRHQKVAEYRRQVWEKYEIVPFPHQAEWICASEGYTLSPDAPVKGQLSQLVELEDGTHTTYSLLPRQGGAAHVCADLAGFKGGKSMSLGMWGCGFAALSDAAVDLIGLEYDTCEPELHYLHDLLCSERGMNLKAESFRSNPKDGAMWLVLDNGARFVGKSYRASRSSETLKGKTRDCYIFCEAYQLPGFHAWSRVAQNVRQRDGFGIFGTTPDRAWVRELHDKAHGKDAYYHCTCDVDAKCNPYTFDQAARDRDDPDKGGLMTRERFAIAWGGKVNRHIGAVYDYDRDAHMFSPLNYPKLWTPEAHTLAMEALPS